jgi:pimeloyl-ACP methyl ester carboxylesterase
MAYFHFLKDAGMNYTLNRPLLDGQAKNRVEEVRAIAPRITDFASWTEAWLGLAKGAETEKRWLDAATYYHQAEFYLPAGDFRNSLYDAFARNFARGMEGVEGYERFRVPYEGGFLPGFRLPARDEKATLVAHGGYDSFIEEFYPMLKPLTGLGVTVVAFDGPGQGGALRQGLYFTHEWEKPAKAVLDHFHLQEVDWLGVSWGGYLSLRAAAFEPRIKRVTALPAYFDGLDMALRQTFPGQARALVSLLRAEDRKGVEALVADQRKFSTVFDWVITQGMHITGTTTPYDCLQAESRHQVRDIAHLVKQDVLLTAGEQDHLFPPECLEQETHALVCARSVTARVFTAREGGEQHCQVGHSALAMRQMINWLTLLRSAAGPA